MAHLLSRLKINEVSSVDRGAGHGVKVMLMKRDDAGDYSSAIAKLDDEVEAYIKREFSDDKRKDLARTGAAMPGGGFPIENGGDLSNAIQAIGRAKNPAAAKSHIKERARALGMSDKIPDTWKRADLSEPELLGDCLEIGKAAVLHGADSESISKAANTILRIMKSGSDEVIEKSLTQFVEHVIGLVPTDKRDAFLAAVAAAPSIGDFVMPMDQNVQKLIDAAVAKALEPVNKELAAVKLESVLAKMTPEHKAHYANLDGDEKNKFAAMSLAERNAHCQMGKRLRKVEHDPEDDHPGKVIDKPTPEGDDQGDESNALGAAIGKAIADVLGKARRHPGETGDAEDDDENSMKKTIAKAIAASPIVKELTDSLKRSETVIKTLTGANEAVAFAKRAEALGLPAAHGEVMRKAYAGDAEAIRKHEEMVKGLVNQIDTSVLFTEFGKATEGGGGASAYIQIRALAKELQKTEAGAKFSIHQAVNKVMMDPANAELVARNKAEEMKKRTRYEAA